jgi:hypothetical protein
LTPVDVSRVLIDDIKTRIREAMKAGRTVEKEILRVALGEIQTAEARGDSGDAVAQGIIKKLVKSNEETLAASSDDAQQAQLQEELAILRTLLPKTLSQDEIVSALAPVAQSIRDANNDGQATGIAMKQLKAQGAAVDGKTVASAVKQLRS